MAKWFGMMKFLMEKNQLYPQLVKNEPPLASSQAGQEIAKEDAIQGEKEKETEQRRMLSTAPT
ncbi:hypothetical protein ACLOJK_021499 [Asimina triloba]